MKLIPKIKPLIIILSISTLLFCSFTPTIYDWNNRGKVKPIRYFELVHNFPTDYNFYLSRIRQGKEGAWLATEKYTSEPHAPSLSQVFYVLIGRVSDWAHVQTPYLWISYHAMRLVFGFLMLFVIWKISEWFFPTIQWQLLSFFIISMASTLPKIEHFNGSIRFGSYMAWYTVMDSMQRTTFMPHVTFSQAVLVFILWVFAGGFITKKHPGNWIFLGIIGIILGIVFPPGLFFLYAVLGAMTLVDVFNGIAAVLDTNKDAKKWFSRWFIADAAPRIIFGALTVPTMIYYSMLFREYPWKRLLEYDIKHPSPFHYWEYFLAVGPVLPLGIIGCVVAIFTMKKIYTQVKPLTVFVLWVVMWLLLLYVFQFIPQQSPTRFSQMMPHVPLGLFTTYLFFAAFTYLKHWAKKIKEADVRFIPYSILVIPAILLSLNIGWWYSSFLWQRDFVDHKLRADIPLVPTGAQVMYPLLDLINAYGWLQVYTERNDIVLSGQTTGNYIPTYAGNTAFIGHANTIDLENKSAAVGNFFNRRLSYDEEIAWLKSTHAKYIIYGPEEREMNGYTVDDLRMLYPELTEVFKNMFVTIYKTPY